MKGQPRRDWRDARAKVDAEGRCRHCLISRGLEAAHVVGRRHDKPKREGSKALWVNPDSIVPLCGLEGQRCHARYDAHELDLIGHLTAEEEARAVLDAGGLELARQRIAPSLYRVAA